MAQPVIFLLAVSMAAFDSIASDTSGLMGKLNSQLC